MLYGILGPLDVTRDGRTIDLGTPKQRRTLAALLLESGRVVPNARLADAVWDDEPPASASASLHAYVSNLRRELRDPESGSSSIVRRPPGYLIEVPSEQIDSERFAALASAEHAAVEQRRWADAVAAGRDALAVWRGPVLADLAPEGWMRVEADLLEDRRADCAEDLVTALLGVGAFGDAVREAGRLRSARPLRERATWLAMLALHRSGRSAEAVDLYHAHVRVLSDDLGVAPGPDLRDLCGAILRHDDRLLAWPGSPPVAGSAPSPPSAPSQPDSRARADDEATLFVGRARESAELDAVLSVPGAWVAITGPAGIGKSRLAAHLAGLRERAGAVVMRIACPDDPSAPPWWPVRALLAKLGLDADEVLAPPVAVDVDLARYAVFDRLHTALAARADTVILIDDVHWADARTAAWLAYEAGIAGGGPELILTVRSGSGSPALDRILEAVIRRPGSRSSVLGPMDGEAMAELVTAVGGIEREDEIDRIRRLAAGNPFFATELARLSTEERAAGGLPLAVRTVLGRRLGSLDAPVLQLLRVAAVAGDPFDPVRIAGGAGVAPLEVDDLVDDAIDSGILVSVGGASCAFSHALLREEVLAGIGPAHRARMHAALAERVGGGPGSLARRAAHLVAAGDLVDPSVAVDACRSAAQDAERDWLWESAAEWWAAASAIRERSGDPDGDADGLLLAEVVAHARSGRRQRVLDAVEQGIADALRRGSIATVGALASALLRSSGSWPWTYVGEVASLIARLRAVEPLTADDPAAHARVLAALAVGEYYGSDRAVSDGHAARALKIARDAGDPDLLADVLLGRALSLSGVTLRAAECETAAEELAALPHRLGQVDAVAVAGLRVMIAMSRADVTRAAAEIERGSAASDALRLPVSRMQFRWASSAVLIWRGALTEAESIRTRAHELQIETQMFAESTWRVSLLPIRWEQGRLAELSVDPLLLAAAPLAAAACLAASGRIAEAEALVERTLATERTETWTSVAELTLLGHVLAALELPRHAERILGLLQPARGLVASFGHTGSIGPVALAMARLYALLGDTAAARDALDEAECLVGDSSPGLALRCRLQRAELDGAHRDELVQIAEAADRIGMAATAARARSVSG